MASPSSRIGQIHGSVTMELTDLVNRLKAEGQDVIGLVGGEPDYHTADAVKAAGIAAIERNITRYPPGDGILPLRQAISARLREDKGIDVPPEQVLVSSGTKPLLQATLLTCADPGDEVVIPAPYWISYPEIARLCGLAPRLLPCRSENRFRPSAEQLRSALGPRARVVILNSPNNPTGAVYDEALLMELAEVLRDHPDVWIVTDEIYDEIHYLADRPPSFAQVAPDLADRTVTINGFSKGFAMAGWRLGYAAASAKVIAAMTNVINHVTGPTSGISQMAGLEALTGDRAYLRDHCGEYRERRDIVVEAINRMPGLSCLEPEGAFFVWGDCSGVLGKIVPEGAVLRCEADFVAAAARAGVMFMPGAAFGMSPYFRISCSVGPVILREAMRRLAAFVSSLRPPETGS